MISIEYDNEVDLFANSYEFSEFIQSWAHKNNMGVKDFLLAYCEDKMIDIEEVIKLISPTLKEVIRHEFIQEYNIKGNKKEVTLTDLL